MFKNLSVYRIDLPSSVVQDGISEQLDAQAFVECGPTEGRSAGWVPPRGEEYGSLVEWVDGQMLLSLMVESKAVPAAVVKRKAEERAREIEATAGRKPGKKETRDLRDEVKQSLLPLAFPKRSSVGVWIDPVAQLLVLDTVSRIQSDDVISLLIRAIDGMKVRDVHTATSPTAAMSHWLTEQEPPDGFSIDRECELHAVDASKAVVRYGHHALDIEEVRQHIAEGKLPTRLAMTWDDRLSFVLTDSLQLRKLVLQDGALESRADDVDAFDADMAIMTGELRRLLPDLIGALGGEVVLDDATAAQAADAGDEDPLYGQAVELVREKQKPSISLVQRHLRIGYNRAARLLETMEACGLVSAMDSAGARQILAEA